MKKSVLYMGLALLSCGLICCAAASFGDFAYTGFLWGLTGAGLACGVATLFTYWYYQDPKRSALYERHIEMKKILFEDERRIMLRDKACYYTFCSLILFECVCIVIFSLLATFGICMPFSRSIVVILSALVLLHLIYNLLVFHWLSRKL